MFNLAINPVGSVIPTISKEKSGSRSNIEFGEDNTASRISSSKMLSPDFINSVLIHL